MAPAFSFKQRFKNRILRGIGWRVVLSASDMVVHTETCENPLSTNQPFAGRPYTNQIVHNQIGPDLVRSISADSDTHTSYQSPLDFLSPTVSQSENLNNHQNKEPDIQSSVLKSPSSITTALIKKNQKLRRGWYMLEARGNSVTIGANLQIWVCNKGSIDKLVAGHSDNAVAGIASSGFHDISQRSYQLWHLQLGSHEMSKRILYCPVNYDSLFIRIEGLIEREDLPSLGLVRISSWFAYSRIMQNSLCE